MTADSNPIEWITTAEAAKMTGYHVNYVCRLLREGKITGDKRGHDWWVDKDSVKAYITEMKRLGAAKHDPWRTGARQSESSSEK
jgi:excisionase family DNA binding protein